MKANIDPFDSFENLDIFPLNEPIEMENKNFIEAENLHGYFQQQNMALHGRQPFTDIPEIEELEDDHNILSEIEDCQDENLDSKAEEDFLTFEEQYAKMIKD